MNKLKLAMLATALAAAYSARAQITVGFTSVTTAGGGPYALVDLTISGTIGGPSPGTTTDNVEAGVYNLNVGGVATPSFCIDVDRDAPSTPNSTYSYASLTSAPPGPSGPMNGTQETIIEQLWAAYGGTSGKNQNFADGAGAVGATVDLAALQVAIWEEMGDGDLGYTVTASADGSDTGVINDATAYRNYVLANTGTLPEADLIALKSGTTQNYIVAVPEPTTMLAGVLLLLPFGASTLRIVRKNRGV